MTVIYAVLFQRMYGCQKTGRNSIVGETFVNGVAVLCLEPIRFFGTEDYWVLGTIELGHSENNIKLLGRWVTKSLTH